MVLITANFGFKKIIFERESNHKCRISYENSKQSKGRFILF